MAGMKPLDKAIDLCGGQSEFARRIGVNPQNVWNWKMRGTPLPAEYCRTAEAATEGRVTRYEFRPDVFGPDPSRRKRA